MEQEKINELKNKFGRIFKMTVNEKDWFYRALTRDEFKEYRKSIADRMNNQEEISQEEIEEIIFTIANLNDITKENLNTVPAGIITVVSEAIMKITGFTDDIEVTEL